MPQKLKKALCVPLCLRDFVVQFLCAVGLICIPGSSNAQLAWKDVSTEFGPLPSSIQVFRSTDTIGGKPSIAYYVIADLKDRKLSFDTDTTLNRRLTPSAFYSKNDQPFVVVNGTFFSFATNQNLNVVVKDKKLVSYNIHSTPMRGKDTFKFRHAFHGAIGITKNRKADVAWLYSDSTHRYPFASQVPVTNIIDSIHKHDFRSLKSCVSAEIHRDCKPRKRFHKWKVQTAIGGGPVLLQDGLVKITNNEEAKFGGKAINDRHPRTAMGYTADNKLVILVVQGRSPGIAEGASLTHLATIMKDIGCVEALNLDGGGSSCLLVNGKETIAPSDKKQRPVPAVFFIGKD